MSYGGSCFRSYLNRFASADTLVPDPANPQSFNRYSYVLNQPLKYRDLSGHCADDDDECIALRGQIEDEYGLSIKGIWRLDELQTFYSAFLEYIEWIGGFGEFNGQFETVYLSTYMYPGEGCYSSEACNRMINFDEAGAPSRDETDTLIGLGSAFEDDTVLMSLLEFRKVVSHELTHAYLDTRGYIIDDYMDAAGWAWNNDSKEWEAQGGMTSYGHVLRHLPKAPEEDLAERIANHLTTAYYLEQNPVPPYYYQYAAPMSMWIISFPNY